MPETKIFTLAKAIEAKIKDSANKDSDEFNKLFHAAAQYDYCVEQLQTDPSNVRVLFQAMTALADIKGVIPEIHKFNAPSILNLISADLRSLDTEVSKELPGAKQAYLAVKDKQAPGNGVT